MKIAIMGSGGIGGYVGVRLAEAGNEVTFIARGAHLEAMRGQGLRLESPDGDVDIASVMATENPAEIGVVDVIIFAVKLGDTLDAAAQLAPMIGPHTRVVTLQNGIDSKDLIARFVDPGQIAAGVIYLASYIKAPGVIFSPGGKHEMVVDAMGGDETMARFFAAVAAAHAIDATPSEAIDPIIWQKFVSLSSLSGVTSLTRLPVGAIRAIPACHAFFEALVEEVLAVTVAKGITLPADAGERRKQVISTQPYDMKSSMLVDLEAGKPLELPWLSGRVVELGRELGIPTPSHAAVVAALAAYVDGPPVHPIGG